MPLRPIAAANKPLRSILRNSDILYDVNANAKTLASKASNRNRVSSAQALSQTTVLSLNNIASGQNDAADVWWTEAITKHKAYFETQWANPMRDNGKLDDFRLTRTLGSGSFGRVILVKHQKTKEYFAMKLLVKEKVVKTKQVEHTLNEKKILQAIDFPFIVRLVYCFKDTSNLYMVLSFENGGEMFTHLRKSRRFNESSTRFYCAQVVLSFDFLHRLGIIYRDLKPENMLLTSTGYTKITDFGFAKRIAEDQRTYTLCGTPEYLAPEVIKHKGYGKSVDWWTVGILIYEMAAGNVPFHCKDHSEMYARIVKGNFKCPEFFSSELCDIIRSLLNNDVSKRYGCLKAGALDVLNHPWFSTTSFQGIYNQTVRPPFVPELAGPGDAQYFHAQKNEEHIHIGASDKFKSLFEEF